MHDWDHTCYVIMTEYKTGKQNREIFFRLPGCSKSVHVRIHVLRGFSFKMKELKKNKPPPQKNNKKNQNNEILAHTIN